MVNRSAPGGGGETGKCYISVTEVLCGVPGALWRWAAVPDGSSGDPCEGVVDEPLEDAVCRAEGRQVFGVRDHADLGM